MTFHDIKTAFMGWIYNWQAARTHKRIVARKARSHRNKWRRRAF